MSQALSAFYYIVDQERNGCSHHMPVEECGNKTPLGLVITLLLVLLNSGTFLYLLGCLLSTFDWSRRLKRVTTAIVKRVFPQPQPVDAPDLWGHQVQGNDKHRVGWGGEMEAKPEQAAGTIRGGKVACTGYPPANSQHSRVSALEELGTQPSLQVITVEDLCAYPSCTTTLEEECGSGRSKDGDDDLHQVGTQPRATRSIVLEQAAEEQSQGQSSLRRFALTVPPPPLVDLSQLEKGEHGSHHQREHQEHATVPHHHHHSSTEKRGESGGMGKRAKAEHLKPAKAKHKHKNSKHKHGTHDKHSNHDKHSKHGTHDKRSTHGTQSEHGTHIEHDTHSKHNGSHVHRKQGCADVAPRFLGDTAGGGSPVEHRKRTKKKKHRTQRVNCGM